MRRRELVGLAAAGVMYGQAEGERRRWLQATLKALTADRRGRTWAAWSGELAWLRRELRAVMEAAEERSAPGETARKTHLLRAAGMPPLFDEMYAGGDMWRRRRRTRLRGRRVCWVRTRCGRHRGG